MSVQEIIAALAEEQRPFRLSSTYSFAGQRIDFGDGGFTPDRDVWVMVMHDPSGDYFAADIVDAARADEELLRRSVEGLRRSFVSLEVN